MQFRRIRSGAQPLYEQARAALRTRTARAGLLLRLALGLSCCCLQHCDTPAFRPPLPPARTAFAGFTLPSAWDLRHHLFHLLAFLATATRALQRHHALYRTHTATMLRRGVRWTPPQHLPRYAHARCKAHRLPLAPPLLRELNAAQNLHCAHTRTSAQTGCAPAARGSLPASSTASLLCPFHLCYIY